MAKQLLYGWASNNVEATARTLVTLDLHHDVRRVGNIGNAIAVMVVQAGRYDVWTLADNGGEINVEKVNDQSTLVSVPYMSNGGGVTAEVMAYRIWQVLHGREIEWDYLDAPGVKGAVEPLRIGATV